MPADLGILLVHGIGSQSRGETLVSFGETIYRTLQDWVEFGPPDERNEIKSTSSRANDKFQLVGARLSPLLNEPSEQAEPAHVRFTIVADDMAAPVEWVMAECHWATSFPP